MNNKWSLYILIITNTLAYAMQQRTLDDLPTLCAAIAQHLSKQADQAFVLEEDGFNLHDCKLCKHISHYTTCPLSIFALNRTKHRLMLRSSDRFFARNSDALVCDPDELEAICKKIIAQLRANWHNLQHTHGTCVIAKNETEVDIDLMELLLEKFDLCDHIKPFTWGTPTGDFYYCLEIDDAYLARFEAIFGLNVVK